MDRPQSVSSVVAANLRELYQTTEELDEINIEQDNPFKAAMEIERILSKQRKLLTFTWSLLGHSGQLQGHGPGQGKTANLGNGQLQPPG